MSITSIPSYESGSEWPSIEWCRIAEWPSTEWCRIERCPKLEHVFRNVDFFKYTYQLTTFWASQLLKCWYISSDGPREFPHLKFLHLDLCPRLIHVLPLYTWVHKPEDSFRLLEILEILWWGNLREIFPLYSNNPYWEPIFFPTWASPEFHYLSNEITKFTSSQRRKLT
jgi:hypothetical protein